MNNSVEVVRVFLLMLALAREHLNTDNSTIPLNILLTVYACDKANEPLTVKALFEQLPHSTMGLRNHFNRLVQNGWIDLGDGENDKRVTTVKPSRKLNQKMENLIDSVIQYL